MEKLKIGDMVEIEYLRITLFGKKKKSKMIGFILLQNKKQVMCSCGNSGVWWFDKNLVRKVKNE